MCLIFPLVAIGFKFEELGTEGLSNVLSQKLVAKAGPPLHFHILLVVLSVINDSFQGFSECASGDLNCELFPAKSRVNRI